MFNESIRIILLRDLDQVRKEILQYPNPGLIWKVIPGTHNSAGNLTLHLCGNLRHFIGSVLGKSGYKRNRDYEFSASNIEVELILQIMDDCRNEVSATFGQMQPGDEEKDYPGEIGTLKGTTGFVLVHLVAHLNYHLGQINYHRRYFSAIPSES